jgi:hypothetical protein
MARMYPSKIADDHGSPAERRIFARLRDQTPDDWLVVHSVGLANHSTKPWAEIDFVLVTDRGVFCLEVKGGHIEHRDGDWYTNGNRLKQSPFAQAGGGASALFAYLSERIPAMKKSLVGHGVMFPDTAFEEHMPEIQQALVYDDRDLGKPMHAYVSRIAEHWKARITDLHGGRSPEPLSPSSRAAIIRELAPDFDLVPSLQARVSEVEDELVRLTEQQKELLGGLADRPRVIVRGGAGTGKTLVACHEATRLAAEGCRTLFICYSSRLADHVRASLAPLGVEVAHMHGLMADLISEAGRTAQLPAVHARDLFDIYYPQTAIDALIDLDRLGSIDALVLDEGQDLLKPTYVQFFDALLKEELARGTWRIFLDPNQDLFLGSPPSELERLESCSNPYRLTKNCRNTREIALATSILSGVKLSETLVAEGPEVAEEWHSGTRERQKRATRVLHDWLERGLRPDQIVVLSPQTLAKSTIGGIERSKLPRQIVDVSRADDQTNSSRIRFSTVAGFKGLEADAVLLTDLGDLTDPESRSLLYVGASRAKILMALLLDENCREQYTSRASELVSQLVGHQTEQG